MSALNHIGKKRLGVLLGAIVIGLALYAVPTAIQDVNAHPTGSATCTDNPGGGFTLVLQGGDVGNPSGGQIHTVIVPANTSCPPGLSTDPNNPTYGNLTVQCSSTLTTLTFVTSTVTYTWIVPTSDVSPPYC